MKTNWLIYQAESAGMGAEKSDYLKHIFVPLNPSFAGGKPKNVKSNENVVFAIENLWVSLEEPMTSCTNCM